MLKIVLLFLMLFFVSSAFAQEVLLITNKGNEVKSVSLTELKQIFIGEKQHWPDGAAIGVAVNFEDKKLIRGFAKMISMEPSAYSNAWIKMTLSGISPPPYSSRDDKDTIEYVKKKKGNIGFINTSSKSEEVSIVEVK